MALTYSRQILSGSTNGRPISIAATASPGTTIHTVQATATDSREELYLQAINDATATSGTRLLTVEYGGTSSGDQIPINVGAGEGVWRIIEGGNLTATSTIVRAYATGANEFRVIGWVNRAT